MSQSNPPLLLTKRLTSFLHSSQSATVPTLLLTTPSGKLLAHASPNPVSVLRTHATVAASLFSIHTSSSVAVPTALPGFSTPEATESSASSVDSDSGDQDQQQQHQQQQQKRRGKDRGKAKKSDGVQPTKPVTITVQLSGGIVVIRMLKCGLLFVCVGPPPAPASEHAEQSPSQQQQHHHHSPDGADPAAASIGSPSEESLVSAGGNTTASLDSVAAAGAAAMRRHASELARWLDDKLGTLAVPEEGVGVYH